MNIHIYKRLQLLNNFPFCGGGIRWNWPPATFFNQFLNSPI